MIEVIPLQVSLSCDGFLVNPAAHMNRRLARRKAGAVPTDILTSISYRPNASGGAPPRGVETRLTGLDVMSFRSPIFGESAESILVMGYFLRCVIL